LKINLCYICKKNTLGLIFVLHGGSNLRPCYSIDNSVHDLHIYHEWSHLKFLPSLLLSVFPHLLRALSSLVSRLVRATDGSFSQGPLTKVAVAGSTWRESSWLPVGSIVPGSSCWSIGKSVQSTDLKLVLFCFSWDDPPVDAPEEDAPRWYGTTKRVVIVEAKMVKGFHPSPNKEKVPTAAPQRGVRCPQASPPLTQERSAFTRKDLRNIPDMSDHPLSRVGPLEHDLGASYLSRSAANTGISGLPLLAIYTAKERPLAHCHTACRRDASRAAAWHPLFPSKN
jgi:hypothetical protein